MFKFFFSLFLVAFFCGQNSFAESQKPLSLEEYLSQVRGQNLSYLAANLNAEAYEKLKEKAKLVTAVTFFVSSQTAFTEQNQALQIIRYTKTYTQTNQAGISQTSDFGLSTKLYYSLNEITYKGLDTSSYANPSLTRSNHQSIPTLELSLPLWQNRFGAYTQASKDSVYFTNESQKLAAKSISVAALVAAEQSYWALAAARRIVEIQKNALESAKQILSYVSKKEKMNLGERGDVLQAQALFESRKLSLRQAENDAKLAERDFNKQRYFDSAEVPERLDNIDLARLQKFLVPEVKGDNRFDVKAYEASMKAAVASAKLDEESNKPSLNLYGSYLQNQIKQNTREAMLDSFAQNGRAGTLGIKFSMPINLGLTSEIRQGAVLSASAAKINYRQKLFEQENDWQNLVQNLAIYKENLALSSAIESAQKSKLENERRLLKQGRTTTYQILLFEQDYSNSQLTTIQLAYKMLALAAQQKLYDQNN
jgi:outer membrane protein TolC